MKKNHHIFGFPWGNTKRVREEASIDMFSKSMVDFDSDMCVLMGLCECFDDITCDEEEMASSLETIHHRIREITTRFQGNQHA